MKIFTGLVMSLEMICELPGFCTVSNNIKPVVSKLNTVSKLILKLLFLN